MKTNGMTALLIAAILTAASSYAFAAAPGEPAPVPPGDATRSGKVKISGIYPHLTAFSSYGEVGIGGVVPWAGKLWMITYPPHEPNGSSDKLYEIDPDLTQHLRPESVGGTHANRLIHRESNQLIIGPYFIDDKGTVRVADIKKLVGRLTATARHLTDPANKVYFIDMEGAIYEVDVHTLGVTKLFDKPVPGWHGKGGYTAQGRLVISNNGERSVGSYAKSKLQVKDLPDNPENAGVLAEWDGKEWKILERRQFVEVTGPGGIYGNPDANSPLWATGWDKRSVMLKLLDGGKWHTFRLPKASHAYDPRHGWYTEWPRIREVGGGKYIMTMHGMFFDFPGTFSAAKTGGIKPMASYLRYVPDLCDWNGQLVLASDEVTIISNKLAGQSQSNLWFGKVADLYTFGPRAGWGGVWVKDAVKAGEPSVPFLINGFDKRVVHLAHESGSVVNFTLEIDANGDGQWTKYQTIAVPASGYQFHILPKDLAGNWIRVTADKDCTATAYFHFASPRDASQDDAAMFASLAKVSDTAPMSGGILRQAKHNRSLQVVAQATDAAGKVSDLGYYEVDQTVTFSKPQEDRTEAVNKVAAIKADFTVDDASVIMTPKSEAAAKKGKNPETAARYRLPKTNAAYDKPFALGQPRGIRELESERLMMNIHGTFYELPLDNGMSLIKPVATHGRQITDYCTWSGLLVLAGNLTSAKPDGHYFATADGKLGLWFGSIDDLWRLGKPVGKGGPWKDSAVKADKASDPYLMTGYDSKKIELSHDAAGDVEMTVEVDIDHHGWVTYKTFTVPAGKTVAHEFPDGYSAHWVRVTAGKDCKATATLTYE